MTKEEWKKLFIKFIKENGIENLNTKTNYKNLGNTFNRIRAKYNKSTPKEQKEMREFWDCFPEDFWDIRVKKTNEQWKELFIKFIKENGIRNLNTNTKYKSLGNTLATIRAKYDKSTPEEQRKMKEFWDCFPDDFWDRKAPERKTDNEWKELFIKFIKENGIENLNLNTKYNNENLGNTLGRIRYKYNKSTPEKQKQMKEFWDCFPDNMWGKKAPERKTDNEWKEIFIQYNNEFGIENLNTSTIWNDNKLGYKILDLKHTYQRVSNKKKEKMFEFWDCFPNDIFNYKKTNEQWKELFNEFINKESFNSLNIFTIWENQQLGKKLNDIINNYCKKPNSKRKELREFWECFPDDFWDKIEQEIIDKKYKELFIEYIHKNQIKTFNQKNIWNNSELREKIKKIKQLFEKSTLEEKKEIREFWDCFPDDFWDTRVKKTIDEWKELFIEFIKENGIRNLNTNTKYKSLGNTLNTLKIKYNKSSPKEQKEMREFWDCFPEDIWENKQKTDNEWKELFIKFIKENGIENLKQTTEYKSLGNKLATIRAKYNKSTPKEQKEMMEFWDCFPESMWGNKSPKPKTEEEWEKIFTQFL